MTETKLPATCYVGQVERDPDGRLWAVLYRQEQILAREQVRTLRHGRRRVTDVVLSAADTITVPAYIPEPARQGALRGPPGNPRGYEMSPGRDRLRAAHAT